MRKRTTWILVADAQRARILENDGPGKGVHALPGEQVFHANPPTREQGAERPGRVQDSTGEARHAIQPHADWHRQEKSRFAQELADHLRRAAADRRADRFVLVAPPQMLGDLRAALDHKTRALVTAEITKDLTATPDRELTDHLAAVLAI